MWAADEFMTDYRRELLLPISKLSFTSLRQIPLGRWLGKGRGGAAGETAEACAAGSEDQQS